MSRMSDPRDAKKVPLTKEAIARLEHELSFKEGEERQKIIEEIATARAHGDLSENAEYHAAKDRQGIEEARIRQIREMLENAEIIETDDDGVAAPGMLVTISHDGDEAETYLLGTREEKGQGYDVLTPDSPIGRAIIGKAAGEVVVAKAPNGDLKVEIIAVHTPN
jgi:transcription elongation factor GreA